MAVETPDEIQKQLDELGGRVIKADRALRCCRSAESRVQIDILGAINQVIGFIASADESKDLAFAPFAVAPALGIQGRFVAVEAGAAATAVLGAVVLASGVQMASWAKTTGALEALEFINQAVGKALSERRSSCYTCIKRNVLPQNSPRKRTTVRYPKRS